MNWWLYAVVTFIGGDAITTAIGLSVGAVEANPTGQLVLASGGLLAMLTIKLLLSATFYEVAKRLPDPLDIGIPIGLTLLGSAVTLWNSYVILQLI